MHKEALIPDSVDRSRGGSNVGNCVDLNADTSL
ncbi:MAG: hypothetical protein ACI8V4_003190, partial [Ilumatobacter sp.]